MGWKNFTDAERLVFDMRFQSGLGMNMRVDDTSLTTNPRNTFLQTPTFGDTFQSYITLTDTQSSTFRIYNSGPETIWVTFDKTRLIFDDVSSSKTFASLLLQANGTSVTSTQDSMAFPVQATLNLTFSSAKNPPATSGSVGVIPVGKYMMKMHVDGYDSKGEKISKTINYGAVTIK
jgi:hypothetical protein